MEKWLLKEGCNNKGEIFELKFVAKTI